jgi:hypothetical protein
MVVWWFGGAAVDYETSYLSAVLQRLRRPALSKRLSHQVW